MNSKNYHWAVPLSAAAPFVAHLLHVGIEPTHKLCAPTFAVNAVMALPVDIRYRPMCRTCWSMAKRGIEIDFSFGGGVIVPNQVSVLRRSITPRTGVPARSKKRK